MHCTRCAGCFVLCRVHLKRETHVSLNRLSFIISSAVVCFRYDLEALKLIEAGSKPKTSKEKDLLLHGGKKKEEPKAKEVCVTTACFELCLIQPVSEHWTSSHSCPIRTHKKRTLFCTQTIRYVDGQPVRCKKGEKFITE